LFEAAEIATVVIAVRAFRDRLVAMHLPRLVVTPFMMGRPLGPPGEADTQRKIILTALGLLEKARTPQTYLEWGPVET
jgi:hypothetical protein